MAHTDPLKCSLLNRLYPSILRTRRFVGLSCKHSFSSCPILEAYKPLQMDTKHIKKVLLVEKLNRFEVEVQKGHDPDMLRTTFPGAYATYKRHKFNFESLNYFLKHKYNINVIAIKAGHSPSFLKCQIGDSNYDAIITAGGDGTYLQSAALIPTLTLNNPPIPIFGINTDPVRSEGRLCLKCDTEQPHLSLYEGISHSKKSYLQNIYIQEILNRLFGDDIPFKPLFRQRLRVSLHSSTQVDHEPLQSDLVEETTYLYKAVNDILIAEENCSRALYTEIQIDKFAKERIKSSGILISTGTGSSAWGYNISKTNKNRLESILKALENMDLLSSKYTHGDDLLSKINEQVNKDLLFDPSSPLLRFTIREPIENRVFKVIKGDCIAKRIKLKPLSSKPTLYIDGQVHFPIPSGKVLVLETVPQDGIWTAR